MSKPGLNSSAEIVSRQQCLQVNVAASKGLQAVLKSNLGPRGTLKMLVGGAGQIKITKDGNVLLHEMQIQHPTAMMIARAATAQDDMTGDGTTSNVLFTGELLRQAERYLSEGLHPRLIVDGFEKAKDKALEVLNEFKVNQTNIFENRELLTNVARTSLQTKIEPHLAKLFTEAVTDAVLTVHEEDEPIDLHMVEIMCMRHRAASDSRFIRGLVLDHGSRHPDMPHYVENCHIMICNVSFEYESSEHASGFFYSNAEEREKLVESERKFTDERCRKVIEFKRSVCKEGENFVIINQKGIDPLALDMFAKEGILALRRAKRRNMERLSLSCGGMQINSVEDLSADMLGWAGKVYETTLGDDKFCFVEDVKNPKSCTILIKGPNLYTIEQLKDSVRDGLRAVKNAIDDDGLIPGAGAFEIALYNKLKVFQDELSGREKIGVQAFADAILIIPKILAENSGFDVHDSLIKLNEEYKKTQQPIGLDINTGDPIDPTLAGIWDNYRVKRQFLHLSTILATQLLLVDEVIRAGRQMGGGIPRG